MQSEGFYQAETYEENYKLIDMDDNLDSAREIRPNLQYKGNKSGLPTIVSASNRLEVISSTKNIDQMNERSLKNSKLVDPRLLSLNQPDFFI